MQKFLNKQRYENIAMKSPDGHLMCYIGSKRANWYVKRNLAVYNSEKEIQLLFNPNGLGHHFDKARNIPVKNICVVCGCDKIEYLSKHHSVPECFRKHFPLKWKSYRSHEILFLCVSCHTSYELEAQKIKHKMIDDYGGEYTFKKDSRIRGHIKTLLKHGHELPENRKLDMQIDIMIHHNLDDLNDDILKKCLEKPGKNPYELYAKNITNHFKFNCFWKQHFIETMKPKFLPSYWTAEYEPLRDNNK
jgi:exonuclease 3'-5' domain-containing protein 2